MLNRPVTKELGLCTILPSCHSLTCSQTWTRCSRTGTWPDPVIQEEKGKRNKIPRGHIWAVTTADVFLHRGATSICVFTPGWRCHLAEVLEEVFAARWVTPAPITAPKGKILLNAWQSPLSVLDYGNRGDKKRGNPWVSVLSTGLPFPGRRSLHTGSGAEHRFAERGCWGLCRNCWQYSI